MEGGRGFPEFSCDWPAWVNQRSQPIPNQIHQQHKPTKPTGKWAKAISSWLFPAGGRLPLSSGPRASSPALAGRGAAAGVYHTPEGSPPGGLSGPGAWVLHSARPPQTTRRAHRVAVQLQGAHRRPCFELQEARFLVHLMEILSKLGSQPGNLLLHDGHTRPDLVDPPGLAGDMAGGGPEAVLQQEIPVI